MHNIILIGTAHIENGKCNSEELYKIIESINPDVIFEEIPPSHFNAFYVTKTHSSLESVTINQYFKNHNVKIIPVDIDISQELSKYQNEINFIFQTIFKHEDYIKLDNEKEDLMIQEGFRYLNSDDFLFFLEKKKVIEKQIIGLQPNNDGLLYIYNLFQNAQHDSRENAMLKNIYNYSKENHFSQAVFLLGAGHRKSIMEKISEYENLSGIKLNWATYGDY